MKILEDILYEKIAVKHDFVKRGKATKALFCNSTETDGGNCESETSWEWLFGTPVESSHIKDGKIAIADQILVEAKKGEISLPDPPWDEKINSKFTKTFATIIFRTDRFMNRSVKGRHCNRLKNLPSFILPATTA